MRIKRAPTMCCVCHAAPILLWNRCTACARMIDPELKRRLQAMTAGQRKIEYAKMTHPAPPPFEWQGDEAALIAMVEQQEQTKSREQTHV